MVVHEILAFSLNQLPAQSQQQHMGAALQHAHLSSILKFNGLPRIGSSNIPLKIHSMCALQLEY